MNGFRSSILALLGLVVMVLVFFALLNRVLGSLQGRYAARAVMTPNEAEFFRRLSVANGRGFVFAQVAMSALIEPVKSGRSGLDAFRRIPKKRVDYTLHDADLSLICVVELDDRTHDRKRDAERDAILANAGIATLRWESSRRPSVPEIRGRVAALRESRGARGHA